MQSCFSELEEIRTLYSFTGAPCQNWEQKKSMVYLWLRHSPQVVFACCKRKICMHVVVCMSCRPPCLVNL